MKMQSAEIRIRLRAVDEDASVSSQHRGIVGHLFHTYLFSVPPCSVSAKVWGMEESSKPDLFLPPFEPDGSTWLKMSFCPNDRKSLNCLFLVGFFFWFDNNGIFIVRDLFHGVERHGKESKIPLDSATNALSSMLCSMFYRSMFRLMKQETGGVFFSVAHLAYYVSFDIIPW